MMLFRDEERFSPETDLKRCLNIVGLVKDPHFHAATTVAKELKQRFPDEFLDPQIEPLLELDWDQYLCQKKRELRGEAWRHDGGLLCFVDGVLLGDDQDLTHWAKYQWSLIDGRTQDYRTLAKDRYLQHLQSTGHVFVFMEVEVAGEAAGRLLMELFSDVCPKAVENFRVLCAGGRGLSRSGFPLTYKGSVFHRVVPNGWVQGGDIDPKRRGDGGESIYGPTFEDESFAIPHNKRGILGMANKGPHSNGSQFYITLQATPWMDRTYVALGWSRA
ncbi:probable inactive peptidyl-prolyl cis-trans isomerase-like 6 isoform X2 [Antennarius striatus]|uniref:probable inactive peptidyl-prolyl cis-trans isomerase-like 6 isoform X2 n=1 Tax=Antennarius striatus TaxID=241820 RepID=UPI0035AFFA98